jgi:hypothetical protein
MMFKKIAGLALSMLFIAGTATAAGEPKAQQAEEKAPEISEQQFQLEQQLMVDDLAKKLKLLGTAHDCAKDAKNAEALRKCSDALRQGITGQS